jgi:hypothetical protein
MRKQPDDKTAVDLLVEVGRALFELEYEEPPKWPSRLAQALGVKGETLRSWRRGHAPFDASHGALDDLMALAERRAEETARARDELRAWLHRNRHDKEKP